MRNYEVRPFEPYHYLMLAESPKSSFSLRHLNIDPDKLIARFSGDECYGRSGFCNGELLICAGVLAPWPNRGIAWALLSDSAKRHIHFIHKAVLEGLEYFIFRLKLHRIEADVCDDLPKAQEWAKHLGFVEESIMPNYGPRGETFIKYVILR